MRKIFSGFLALMVSVSLFAGRVSQEDAALVANNFMRGSVAASGASKAPAKKMVLKKAASEQENRYYVYEYENGEGWVVVAANDAITPILAYSKTGHFRTDNQPANVRNWFDQYDNFIKKVEADGAEQTEEAKALWDKLRKSAPEDPEGNVIVDVLVQTQWDQDSPYWNLCPGSGSNKAYTGCVATAMAQVMKYWEWPTKGTGSHTYQPVIDVYDDDGYYVRTDTVYDKITVNFGNTTYDWANMKNTYSGSATNAQKQAVATLMYHCGVSVDMQYGDDSYDGSGALPINYGDANEPSSQNAFPKYFSYKKSGLTSYIRDGAPEYGYSQWTDADWTNMIKAELDKYHPIMYAGGAHSFICDGYTDLDYFHFNWGWSGWNDGWYTLSNLRPGSGGAGGGNYDFTEGQDVLIGIVPDKTWPKYAVTWSVDGVETVVNAEEHSQLVLPADPEACASGKVFVGWTKQSTLDGSKPADLMTEARGIVTEPVTYYAVFANAEQDGSTPTATTYTFTSKSWADNTSSWSSNKAGSQYSSTQGVQITTAYTGAGATTKQELNSVSKVVVTYSTNSNKGEGSINVKVGSKSVSKQVTKTGGTTARTLEFPFDFVSGKVSFTVNCTTNSIYVKSVAITTGGGTVYSDYSLDCGTAEPCTHSITIQKGTPENGAFALDKTGEQESCKKLVVKVNNIAPAMGYKFKEIKQTGITSGVTIDQSAKTVTYDKDIDGTSTINVIFEALPTYTIRFFNNGEQIGEAQSVIEGQSPVVPANPTAANPDYTFAGWWTSTLPADNKTAYAWITNFTATKNQDYHAIFSKTVEGGGTAPTDKYKRISAKSDLTTDNFIVVGVYNSNYFAMLNEQYKNYYIGQQQVTPSGDIITTTDATIIWKLTVANNKVSFFNEAKSQYLYMYQSGTHYNLGLTESSSDNIYFTYSISDGVWDFVSTAFTSQHLEYYGSQKDFAAWKNAADPIYLYKQQEGSSSTTYYSSVVENNPQAIDLIQTGEKAVKVLENGMVVIIRGNEKYSIFGQKIK